MLTVDDYATIRVARRDGMSIRAIAGTFGHSRRKVREVLANAPPKPYNRTKDPPAPVLGALHPVIDAIRAADEDAPPTQRHTAMQLYRRLRDEHGYPGGYDQVRRYVGKHRRDRRATFIPLAHDAGQRLACDCGHIHVDFPDRRRPVPVRVAAGAYANYPVALARPTERTEAIRAGMVAAFAFCGRVPRAVWWDNPTTVVRQTFRGRDRRPNARYAALASHYAFEALFCMPARGNAKPRAATRVRVLQRPWATPVPRVPDLGALNTYLRQRCAGAAERTVAGYDESIGHRSARDQAAALPLPAHPFDACVTQAARVDKYPAVRFDHHRYSVPRACAYRAVTVTGYVDRVKVVDGSQVVARHARRYGRDEQVLGPLHYLAALGRRPAALDHAPVLRDGRRPASFADLRRALEGRHGPAAGARHYVRVLRRLAEHPLGRVAPAAAACLRRGERHAERVGAEARRLAGAASPPAPVTPFCQYQVPRPDLGRFNQLLSPGDPEDGR